MHDALGVGIPLSGARLNFRTLASLALFSSGAFFLRRLILDTGRNIAATLRLRAEPEGTEL